MINTILAAIDGSKYAKKAAEFAAGLARTHNAELILFAAYRPEYFPEVMGASMVASVVTDAARDRIFAEKIVADAAAQAKEAGAKSVETIVGEGDAAALIIETAAAKNVDTIVMGNRGHGTLKGLLVGSVSTKVTAHAECTCITVR